MNQLDKFLAAVGLVRSARVERLMRELDKIREEMASATSDASSKLQLARDAAEREPARKAWEQEAGHLDGFDRALGTVRRHRLSA